MCRRSHLRGWCLVALGLGLMAGHCLESWLLCSAGGFFLVMFGLCLLRKK